MKARLIIGILACLGCGSLAAATKEPVYLGIDVKGVRHESKESAGNGPWMRDLKHFRMPTPMPGARWDWYQGVGIFRLRIDPTSGSTKDVTILRSTGHTMFDRGAVLALKVWSWKPGTWSQVDIPIAFRRGGGVLFFPHYAVLPVRPRK